LKLIQPFDCTTVVLRRSSQAYAASTRSASIDTLHTELPQADFVVLALALTDETCGIIGAREFEKMKKTATVINVARGANINTDDLVAALSSGQIAAAALDVTDPEPLPQGHPLWHLPNCLITPHTANTPEMGIDLLCKHVEENVRRYISGMPLLGAVNVAAGY